MIITSQRNMLFPETMEARSVDCVRRIQEQTAANELSKFQFFSCVPCCMNLHHITYCVLSTVYCFMHFVVVKPTGHGSCIIGHGSVFVWFSGSWVTAYDPLPALL